MNKKLTKFQFYVRVGAPSLDLIWKNMEYLLFEAIIGMVFLWERDVLYYQGDKLKRHDTAVGMALRDNKTVKRI